MIRFRRPLQEELSTQPTGGAGAISGAGARLDDLTPGGAWGEDEFSAAVHAELADETRRGAH